MSRVKSYRYQNVLSIFILIVFSTIYFLIGNPNQNYKKEILKLDKTEIYWYVYKKEEDKEVHNYRTIWFNTLGNLNVNSLHRMWHPMYETLYNCIEIGDTIIKPKGSTEFTVKNGKKNKVVSLDRKGN